VFFFSNMLRPFTFPAGAGTPLNLKRPVTVRVSTRKNVCFTDVCELLDITKGTGNAIDFRDKWFEHSKHSSFATEQIDSYICSLDELEAILEHRCRLKPEQAESMVQKLRDVFATSSSSVKKRDRDDAEEGEVVEVIKQHKQVVDAAVTKMNTELARLEAINVALESKTRSDAAVFYANTKPKEVVDLIKARLLTPEGLKHYMQNLPSAEVLKWLSADKEAHKAIVQRLLNDPAMPEASRNELLSRLAQAARDNATAAQLEQWRKRGEDAFVEEKKKAMENLVPGSPAYDRLLGPVEIMARTQLRSEYQPGKPKHADLEKEVAADARAELTRKYQDKNTALYRDLQEKVEAEVSKSIEEALRADTTKLHKMHTQMAKPSAEKAGPGPDWGAFLGPVSF
jgi:hypothetical protein